jgi:SAM-dependent methyltransferase
VPEDLIPPPAAPGHAAARQWALRADPRFAVRTAVVWDTLLRVLRERPAGLDVVDVGGGTGGFAVLLADLGHRVTVVDPSPDALAALQRRAAEAGVADRVRAEQGDAGSLASVLGAGSADVVLCHGVLEVVDDPGSAVQDALEVLRPGGLVSLLVHQRMGAVLARALSGRFLDARALLDDGAAPVRDAAGRRFDREEVLGFFDPGRTRVQALEGIRVFTDLLPGALVDGDPEAARELLDLERAAREHPDLVGLAAQLHVVVQVAGG